MHILLIDNYDSFVYNLYHLLASFEGVTVTVLRNDDNRVRGGVAANEFDAVVIGPGPGSPDDKHYFGNCLEVIQNSCNTKLPILGVCLGFQGIAYAFGASLKRAQQPMHGKLSSLDIHQPSVLFADIPDSPVVMRYHSIMIDAQKPIPNTLRITAEVTQKEASAQINGREIMAIEHTSLPIYGVQFHPESYACDEGYQIIENFINTIK